MNWKLRILFTLSNNPVKDDFGYMKHKSTLTATLQICCESNVNLMFSVVRLADVKFTSYNAFRNESYRECIQKFLDFKNHNYDESITDDGLNWFHYSYSQYPPCPWHELPVEYDFNGLIAIETEIRGTEMLES